MKETWAEELKGVCIRVTSIGMYTHTVSFVRTDTGEAIENIMDYRVEGKVGNLNWLTMTLVHYAVPRMREMDRESYTTSNVEIDLVTRTDAKDIPDMDMVVEIDDMRDSFTPYPLTE